MGGYQEVRRWAGSSARRKGGMPGPGPALFPSLIPAMARGHGGQARHRTEGGGAEGCGTGVPHRDIQATLVNSSWGFPSQFQVVVLNQPRPTVLMATPQGRRLGYHRPSESGFSLLGKRNHCAARGGIRRARRRPSTSDCLDAVQP